MARRGALSKPHKLDRVCGILSRHAPDQAAAHRLRLLAPCDHRSAALSERRRQGPGRSCRSSPTRRRRRRTRRSSRPSRRRPAGAGVTFSQSYGNSGDQARAGHRRPADRHRGAVARAGHHEARQGEARRRRLGLDADKGHRHALGRGARGAARQPEADQGLGRPRQARGRGADAEPVHVRRRALAHHGGVRRADRAGQSEAEAVAYLGRLFRNVVVQDKSARESLQNFTGGKGDVLISYENEAITGQRRARSSTTCPGRDDPHREPDRGDERGRPEGGKAFIDFATSEPAQRIFAAKGYRSVIDALVDKGQTPSPRACSTSRGSAGGTPS